MTKLCIFISLMIGSINIFYPIGMRLTNFVEVTQTIVSKSTQ